MTFNHNQIYHLFNQGNNKRQVFFTSDNYTYFLFKLRGALSPFGDFIAYCLMPNHYHILFFVRNFQVAKSEYYVSIEESEARRRKFKFGAKARPVETKAYSISKGKELISLSMALGKVQSSYTRAINIEKEWSGSLFRSRFKARDGMITDFIETNENPSSTSFNFNNPYAARCMEYIHKNPVKAGMVQRPEEYNWSSAKDYAGVRKGTLCNLEIGRALKGYYGAS